MWVHCLPGRGRARIPGLRGNSALAASLTRRLAACPGIRDVTARPLTGTVLIDFDPGRLTLEQLEAVLCAFAEPEAAAAAETAEAADSPESAMPAPLPPALQGLSADEVERRRAEHGSNVLLSPTRPTFLRRLLDQYKDVMQLTLVAGVGASFLTGHRRDGMTLAAVLLLNGLIGAAHAGDRSRPLAALGRLTDPKAKVIREGVEQTVPATELVPGDLLCLEAGDRVPADSRVVFGTGLGVDESILTGECAAVDKVAGKDPLHAGTAVIRGRGHAVVTATGMNSTLGRIAGLLEGAGSPAPLQRDLDGLGRRLARSGMWVAAGVAGVSLLRGQGAPAALLAGVSLAISAIPEGLPTFTTLALSHGARRLKARNATFQNLPAVEAMGAVTALCCDKTGTLTEGQMCVSELYLVDGVWQVTGNGYCPDGEYLRDGVPSDPLEHPGAARLLKVAALCNNARLGLDEKGALVTQGDPTEVALLVAALKAGLRACGGEGDRLLEVPFDSERCRMTVVCRGAGGQATACVKGAPEEILGRCTQVFAGRGVRRLNRPMRRRIGQAVREMAARGLRVLAVAYRQVAPGISPEAVERDLVLLGLVGMVDPPRPESAETAARCRKAGVRVVMITGDHPATAAAIAAAVGLSVEPGRILTGTQLLQMNDDELKAAMRRVAVVARAAPEQKIRVVRVLKQMGHVVAMTGDGVNDAPAMREADVGIAMGDRGTEIARATAGLVLEDDHLGTVVDAMEQGRSTRGNVRRTARYLLGSNAAELCLMAASLVVGHPLPLLPVQLLWMNLVGDGLPAAALGSQPPEPGLMHRPPDASGGLLGPAFGRQVAGHGLAKGLAATGLYAWALSSGRPLAQARTLAMATLASGQVTHLFACRSRGDSAQVVTAGKVAAGLTLAAIYFPPLRSALQLAPVGLTDLAIAAGVGMIAK